MDGDTECICYICHELLTDDPDAVETPAAKRSRLQGWEGGPQPSTSAAAAGGGMVEVRRDDTVVPELVTTVCGHIFHRQCLLGWIKRKKECPTCRRAKITPGKLTRIFLPLTPGQCKQCKVREKEVEEAQLERVLAKSKAEECELKEQEWRDRYNAAVKGNKELNEKLDEKEEELEELGAQLVAEKVATALREREKEGKFKEREAQLLGKVEDEGKKRREWEERGRILREHVERLEREKRGLVNALGQQKNKKSTESTEIVLWKRLYQLKHREKEKYKSARDYERDRANFFREWSNKGENRSKEETAHDNDGAAGKLGESLFTTGITIKTDNCSNNAGCNESQPFPNLISSEESRGDSAAPYPTIKNVTATSPIDTLDDDLQLSESDEEDQDDASGQGRSLLSSSLHSDSKILSAPAYHSSDSGSSSCSSAFSSEDEENYHENQVKIISCDENGDQEELKTVLLEREDNDSSSYATDSDADTEDE